MGTREKDFHSCLYRMLWASNLVENKMENPIYESMPSVVDCISSYLRLLSMDGCTRSHVEAIDTLNYEKAFFLYLASIHLSEALPDYANKTDNFLLPYLCDLLEVSLHMLQMPVEVVDPECAHLLFLVMSNIITMDKSKENTKPYVTDAYLRYQVLCPLLDASSQTGDLFSLEYPVISVQQLSRPSLTGDKAMTRNSLSVGYKFGYEKPLTALSMASSPAAATKVMQQNVRQAMMQLCATSNQAASPATDEELSTNKSESMPSDVSSMMKNVESVCWRQFTALNGPSIVLGRINSFLVGLSDKMMDCQSVIQFHSLYNQCLTEMHCAMTILSIDKFLWSEEEHEILLDFIIRALNILFSTLSCQSHVKQESSVEEREVLRTAFITVGSSLLESILDADANILSQMEVGSAHRHYQTCLYKLMKAFLDNLSRVQTSHLLGSHTSFLSLLRQLLSRLLLFTLNCHKELYNKDQPTCNIEDAPAVQQYLSTISRVCQLYYESPHLWTFLLTMLHDLIRRQDLPYHDAVKSVESLTTYTNNWWHQRFVELTNECDPHESIPSVLELVVGDAFDSLLAGLTICETYPLFRVCLQQSQLNTDESLLALKNIIGSCQLLIHHAPQWSSYTFNLIQLNVLSDERLAYFLQEICGMPILHQSDVKLWKMNSSLLQHSHGCCTFTIFLCYNYMKQYDLSSTTTTSSTASQNFDTLVQNIWSNVIHSIIHYYSIEDDKNSWNNSFILDLPNCLIRLLQHLFQSLSNHTQRRLVWNHLLGALIQIFPNSSIHLSAKNELLLARLLFLIRYVWQYYYNAPAESTLSGWEKIIQSTLDENSTMDGSCSNTGHQQHVNYNIQLMQRAIDLFTQVQEFHEDSLAMKVMQQRNDFSQIIECISNVFSELFTGDTPDVFANNLADMKTKVLATLFYRSRILLVNLVMNFFTPLPVLHAIWPNVQSMTVVKPGYALLYLQSAACRYHFLMASNGGGGALEEALDSSNQSENDWSTMFQLSSTSSMFSTPTENKIVDSTISVSQCLNTLGNCWSEIHGKLSDLESSLFSKNKMNLLSVCGYLAQMELHRCALLWLRSSCHGKNGSSNITGSEVGHEISPLHNKDAFNIFEFLNQANDFEKECRNFDYVSQYQRVISVTRILLDRLRASLVDNIIQGEQQLSDDEKTVETKEEDVALLNGLLKLRCRDASMNLLIHSSHLPVGIDNALSELRQHILLSSKCTFPSFTNKRKSKYDDVADYLVSLASDCETLYLSSNDTPVLLTLLHHALRMVPLLLSLISPPRPLGDQDLLAIYTDSLVGFILHYGNVSVNKESSSELTGLGNPLDILPHEASKAESKAHGLVIQSEIHFLECFLHSASIWPTENGSPSKWSEKLQPHVRVVVSLLLSFLHSIHSKSRLLQLANQLCETIPSAVEGESSTSCNPISVMEVICNLIWEPRIQWDELLLFPLECSRLALSHGSPEVRKKFNSVLKRFCHIHKSMGFQKNFCAWLINSLFPTEPKVPESWDQCSDATLGESKFNVRRIELLKSAIISLQLDRDGKKTIRKALCKQMLSEGCRILSRCDLLLTSSSSGSSKSGDPLASSQAFPMSIPYLLDLLVTLANGCQSSDGHKYLFTCVSPLVQHLFDVLPTSKTTETASILYDVARRCLSYSCALMCAVNVKFQEDVHQLSTSTHRRHHSHQPQQLYNASTDFFRMRPVRNLFSEILFRGNTLDLGESMDFLCTFNATQKDYMDQHWYYCYTCNMVKREGVCSACARICHRTHELAYAKKGSFFCDCGAKGSSVCQALTEVSASKQLALVQPLPAPRSWRESQILPNLESTNKTTTMSVSSSLTEEEKARRGKATTIARTSKFSSESTGKEGGTHHHSGHRDRRPSVGNQSLAASSKNGGNVFGPIQNTADWINRLSQLRHRQMTVTLIRLSLSSKDQEALAILMSKSDLISAVLRFVSTATTCNNLADLQLSSAETNDENDESNAAEGEEDLLKSLRRHCGIVKLSCTTAKVVSLREELTELVGNVFLNGSLNACQPLFLLATGSGGLGGNVSSAFTPQNFIPPSSINSSTNGGNTSLLCSGAQISLAQRQQLANGAIIKRCTLSLISTPPSVLATPDSAAHPVCLFGQRHQRQYLTIGQDKGKLGIVPLSQIQTTYLNALYATLQGQMNQSNRQSNAQRDIGTNVNASIEGSENEKRESSLEQFSIAPFNNITSHNVGFVVTNTATNPHAPYMVAVCGLRECVVLSYSPTGLVTGQMSLEVNFDSASNDYIMKCCWVPGRLGYLAILLPHSVQVFDVLQTSALTASHGEIMSHLSTTNTTHSRKYHFAPVDGKFRDVTFYTIESESSPTPRLFILVMTHFGVILIEEMTTSNVMSSGDDIFYLAEVLEWNVDGRLLACENGNMFGQGGVSMYYSSKSGILWHSYANKKVFATFLRRHQSSSNKMNFVRDTIPVDWSASGLSGISVPPLLAYWSEGVTATPAEVGLILAQSITTGAFYLFHVNGHRIAVKEVNACDNYLASSAEGMRLQDAILVPSRFIDRTLPPHVIVLFLTCNGRMGFHVVNTNDDRPALNWSDMEKARSSAGRTLSWGRFIPRSVLLESPEEGRPSCQIFEYSEEILNLTFKSEPVNRIYTKEQCHARLKCPDVQLSVIAPEGYCINVRNTSRPDLVIVAVRVCISLADDSRRPTYLKIFGRKYVTVGTDKPRIYDMVLYLSEMRSITDSVDVFIGPSRHSDHIISIDWIRLFGCRRSWLIDALKPSEGLLTSDQSPINAPIIKHGEGEITTKRPSKNFSVTSSTNSSILTVSWLQLINNALAHHDYINSLSENFPSQLRDLILHLWRVSFTPMKSLPPNRTKDDSEQVSMIDVVNTSLQYILAMMHLTCDDGTTNVNTTPSLVPLSSYLEQWIRKVAEQLTMNRMVVDLTLLDYGHHETSSLPLLANLLLAVSHFGVTATLECITQSSLKNTSDPLYQKLACHKLKRIISFVNGFLSGSSPQQDGIVHKMDCFENDMEGENLNNAIGSSTNKSNTVSFKRLTQVLNFFLAGMDDYSRHGAIMDNEIILSQCGDSLNQCIDLLRMYLDNKIISETKLEENVILNTSWADDHAECVTVISHCLCYLTLLFLLPSKSEPSSSSTPREMKNIKPYLTKILNFLKHLLLESNSMVSQITRDVLRCFFLCPPGYEDNHEWITQQLVVFQSRTSALSSSSSRAVPSNETTSVNAQPKSGTEVYPKGKPPPSLRQPKLVLTGPSAATRGGASSYLNRFTRQPHSALANRALRGRGRPMGGLYQRATGPVPLIRADSEITSSPASPDPVQGGEEQAAAPIVLSDDDEREDLEPQVVPVERRRGVVTAPGPGLPHVSSPSLGDDDDEDHDEGECFDDDDDDDDDEEDDDNDMDVDDEDSSSSSEDSSQSSSSSSTRRHYEDYNQEEEIAMDIESSNSSENGVEEVNYADEEEDEDELGQNQLLEQAEDQEMWELAQQVLQDEDNPGIVEINIDEEIANRNIEQGGADMLSPEEWDDVEMLNLALQLSLQDQERLNAAVNQQAEPSAADELLPENPLVQNEATNEDNNAAAATVRLEGDTNPTPAEAINVTESSTTQEDPVVIFMDLDPALLNQQNTSCDKMEKVKVDRQTPVIGTETSGSSDVLQSNISQKSLEESEIVLLEGVLEWMNNMKEYGALSSIPCLQVVLNFMLSLRPHENPLHQNICQRLIETFISLADLDARDHTPGNNEDGEDVNADEGEQCLSHSLVNETRQLFQRVILFLLTCSSEPVPLRTHPSPKKNISEKTSSGTNTKAETIQILQQQQDACREYLHSYTLSRLLKESRVLSYCHGIITAYYRKLSTSGKTDERNPPSKKFEEEETSASTKCPSGTASSLRVYSQYFTLNTTPFFSAGYLQEMEQKLSAAVALPQIISGSSPVLSTHHEELQVEVALRLSYLIHRQWRVNQTIVNTPESSKVGTNAYPCDLPSTIDTTNECWPVILCELLEAGPVESIAVAARKLLRSIVGEKCCRQLRDAYKFSSNLNFIINLCKKYETCGIFGAIETELTPSSLIPYGDRVKLLTRLREIETIADVRRDNWVNYAVSHEDTMAHLFDMASYLHRDLGSILLKLILSAMGLNEKRSAKTNLDKTSINLLRYLAINVKETSLESLMRRFFARFVSVQTNVENLEDILLAILRCDQSGVFKKKCLSICNRMMLDGDFHSIFRRHVFTLLQHLLLTDEKSMETGSEEDTAAAAPACDESLILNVWNTILHLTERAALELTTHPCAQISESLAKWFSNVRPHVERDFCFLCTHPVAAFNTLRWDSDSLDVRRLAKGGASPVEVRSTFDAHVFKFKSEPMEIKEITLKFTVNKRSRQVRRLFIYSLDSDTKQPLKVRHRPELWELVHCEIIENDQTEVKVQLPCPVYASFLIFHYKEFYTPGPGEKRICIRCQIPVTGTVCNQCKDTVNTCHRCRCSNAASPDPFLCIYCNACRFGKIEFQVTARPHPHVTSLESDEERSIKMKTIENLTTQIEGKQNDLEKLRRKLEVTLSELETTSAGRCPTSSTTEENQVDTNKETTLAMQPHPKMKEVQQIMSDWSTLTTQSLLKQMQLVAARRSIFYYDSHTSGGGSFLALTEKGKMNHDVADHMQSTRLYQICFFAVQEVFTSCLALIHKLLVQEQKKSPQSATSSNVETPHSLVQKSSAHLVETFFNDVLVVCDTNHRRYVHAVLCLLTANNQQLVCDMADRICEQVFATCSQSLVNYRMARVKVISILALLDQFTQVKDGLAHIRLRALLHILHKCRGLSHSGEMTSKTVTQFMYREVVRPVLAYLGSFLTSYGTTPLLTVTSTMDSRSDSHTWLLEANLAGWVQNIKLDGKESLNRVHAHYLEEKYYTIWSRKTISKHKSLVEKQDTSWLLTLCRGSHGRYEGSEVTNNYGLDSTLVHILVQLLTAGWDRVLIVIRFLVQHLFPTDTNKFPFYINEEMHSLLLQFLQFPLHFGFTGYMLIRLHLLDRLHGLLRHCLIRLSAGAHFSGKIHVSPTIESIPFYTPVSEYEQTLVGKCILQITQLLHALVVRHQSSKLLSAFHREWHIQECLRQCVLLHHITTGQGVCCSHFVTVWQQFNDIIKSLTEVTGENVAVTEEHKKSFIKIALYLLREDCSPHDWRSSSYLLDHIGKCINPSDYEQPQYQIVLHPCRGQEEFIYGRLSGIPIPSSSIGGPLVSHLAAFFNEENDLDMGADAFVLEFLVENNVLAPELRLDDVYQLVWLRNTQNKRESPMKVFYRIAGMAEGTDEQRLENLCRNPLRNEEEVEHFYRLAGVFAEEDNNLLVLFERLDSVADLFSHRGLMQSVLRVLDYCLKKKIVREKVKNPRLNSVKYLLHAINVCLHSTESEGTIFAASLLKYLRVALNLASSVTEPSERALFVQQLGNEESLLELLRSMEEHCLVQLYQKDLASVVSLLAFGDESRMKLILDFFEPHLALNLLDSRSLPSTTRAMLLCFCNVVGGISNDASGSRMKDMLIERGILDRCIDYLVSGESPLKDVQIDDATKSGSPYTIDSDQLQAYLNRHQLGLPIVLRIMYGCCVHGHTTSGERILQAHPYLLAFLHRLETVTSVKEVGSLAEDLLDQVQSCGEHIANTLKQLRQQTREEKRRKAMAVREKRLQELRMQTNERGQLKVLESAVPSHLNLTDEPGYECVVCKEGYHLQPQRLLCVYVFCKRLPLEDAIFLGTSPTAASTQQQQLTLSKIKLAYSTVSNFVCIHQECHAQAVKSGGGAALSTTTAANQSTAEPAEWRIARRHNADVRCNALLPLPSSSIDKSKWAAKLGRTHQFTELATQLAQDPSISIHDLRYLFMRMAWERPLGEDTAGGSRESNLQLAVYQCAVALCCLSQNKICDLLKLSEQLQTYWLDENRPLLVVNSCWDVKGPLYQSLLCLFVLPTAEWNILRTRILFCLLILAQARQVIPPPPPGQSSAVGAATSAAVSSSTDVSTTDVAAAGGAAAASSGYVVNSLWKEDMFPDFNVYKPYCLYWALLDGFYNNIFKDVTVNESENEQWNGALFKYIQNNQVTLIEAVKKFSQNFEEDLLPCASFMEFCDCCGLLDVLPMKPDDFLANALAAVNSKSSCV